MKVCREEMLHKCGQLSEDLRLLFRELKIYINLGIVISIKTTDLPRTSGHGRRHDEKEHEPCLIQQSKEARATWGAQAKCGLVAPASEAEPTGSIACQPRGQLGPGPTSDGTFWTWPWLLGHEEVAAARVTWQRPWLDCWPKGGLLLRAAWVSRMRDQDRDILNRMIVSWEKSPLVERERNILSSLHAPGVL